MKKFTLMTLLCFFALGINAQGHGLKVSDAPENGNWAENTTWYTIQNKKDGYVSADAAYCNSEGYLLLNNTTTPAYYYEQGALWCIVGNETDGYKFYNKAEGTGKALYASRSRNSGSASFKMATDDNTANFFFDIAKSQKEGYIVIKDHNNENNYWNFRSPNLAYWNSTSATNDDGSSFSFVEVAESSRFLAPDKIYTISTTERGGWSVKADGSQFCSTADGGLGTNVDAANPRNQFAIVRSERNYYLYSIYAEKFVNADRTLSKSPQDALDFDDAGDERARVNFKDIANKYINLGGSNQMTIDGWSTMDAGNKVKFVEVEGAEFNPSAALDYYNTIGIFQKELKQYLDEVTANYKEGSKWRISTELNAYSHPEGYEYFDNAINTAYSYTTQELSGTSVIADQRAAIEELVKGLTINQPETGKYYTLRCVNGRKRLLSVVSNDRYEMSEEEGTGTINTTFLLEANGKNKTLLAYGTGLYMNTHAPVEVGETPATVVFTAAATKKGEYNINVNNRYIYGQGNTQNNHIDSGTSNPGTNSGYSWWIEKVDTLPVRITDAQYASFYAPVAVTIPEGVTAYYLTSNGVKDGKVIMTAIKGNAIPANTGVILYANVTETTTFKFAITDDAEAIEEENLFAGTVAKTNVPGDAYILGVNNGTVGLYKVEGGDTNGGFTNGSHKAYLPVAAVGSAALSTGFTFDFEGTTAIEEVVTEVNDNIYYDLSGRRVENPTRGIYIVNGRKVMVK